MPKKRTASGSTKTGDGLSKSTRDKCPWTARIVDTFQILGKHRTTFFIGLNYNVFWKLKTTEYIPSNMLCNQDLRSWTRPTPSSVPHGCVEDWALWAFASVAAWARSSIQWPQGCSNSTSMFFWYSNQIHLIQSNDALNDAIQILGTNLLIFKTWIGNNLAWDGYGPI